MPAYHQLILTPQDHEPPVAGTSCPPWSPQSERSKDSSLPSDISRAVVGTHSDPALQPYRPADSPRLFISTTPQSLSRVIRALPASKYNGRELGVHGGLDSIQVQDTRPCVILHPPAWQPSRSELVQRRHRNRPALWNGPDVCSGELSRAGGQCQQTYQHYSTGRRHVDRGGIRSTRTGHQCSR